MKWVGVWLCVCVCSVHTAAYILGSTPLHITLLLEWHASLCLGDLQKTGGLPACVLPTFAPTSTQISTIQNIYDVNGPKKNEQIYGDWVQL